MKDTTASMSCFKLRWARQVMKVKGILCQPVEQFPGYRFMCLFLWFKNIRYVPISCVLSLLDLGGHRSLGRQKELMRRNVLGRRQSDTGKWSYKSYNIYQYLTCVRILTLLAYLFYPLHFFQMQSPDLQASDPLQKFRRHCGRSSQPVQPESNLCTWDPMVTHRFPPVLSFLGSRWIRVQDLEKRLQEQKEKEEREEQEFLEAHTAHIDHIDTYHVLAYYISTVDSTACFQTISSRKGDAEIFGKLSESKLFHSCFKCVIGKMCFKCEKMWKDVRTSQHLNLFRRWKRNASLSGLDWNPWVRCLARNQTLESARNQPGIANFAIRSARWFLKKMLELHRMRSWQERKPLIRCKRWSLGAANMLPTCYQRVTTYVYQCITCCK